MNKIALTICLTFLTGGLVFSQSVPEKAGKLEDVVIKEKGTLKIKTEKPVLKLEHNPMEVIYPMLEDQEILESQFFDMQFSSAISPYDLDSASPAKPWLTSIMRDAKVKFRLNLPSGYTVEKWDFVVTDYHADPLKKFSGSKQVPKYIEWDMRDEKGDIIRVGSEHSYVFTFADRAGNRRSVAGEPFVIDALVHREKYGLVTSLAWKFLFEPKLNISLIEEMAEIMKEYFHQFFTVRAFFESEESALQKAKIVAKELSSQLMIPKGVIKTEGRKALPEDFRIDLLISNRRD